MVAGIEEVVAEVGHHSEAVAGGGEGVVVAKTSALHRASPTRASAPPQCTVGVAAFSGVVGTTTTPATLQ